MRDGATLPLLLKELKLPTMLRMWQEIASEAQEKGWSPTRYLTSLCEYELSDRERRRLSRRISESQLPRGKSLESYDFACVPSLDRSQIEALATGEIWIRECRNLLLFGASGVGKTHLAAGIGERLVMSGYRILFYRTTELLQKLQSSKRDFSLPSMLSRLDRYDCLILDDFGYAKKSSQETDLLFELISERYERRSLIITCNQPFQEWDEIFENRRMAVAAVDRLVHHATCLELTAESYRMRAAHQSQKK